MTDLRLSAAISADYGAGTGPAASGGGVAPVPAAGKAPQNPGLPGIDPTLRPQPPTEAELRQAVASLQRKAQTVAPNLQFSIDRDTSRVVIRVTDSSTQEVIRQFPPDEILRMDKELDRMLGMLLNKKA